MKKIWQKPKLIILVRGRPEEFVLAGCKVKGSPITKKNKDTGCQRLATCANCKQVGTS